VSHPGSDTEVGVPADRLNAPGAAGALPNLIVIGAQKCGTSALHSYLARHPEISMSHPKELNFFVAEQRPETVSAAIKNWSLGVDWYRAQFEPEATVRGESSPNYTADPALPGVPGRMAKIIPDAKVIFMVRDPVDRARAQWIHTYSNRVQRKPLHRAVLEDEEYVARSSYHHQLSLFTEHYPMERILVLEQDELLHDREATLKRVFNFLGVDRDFWHPAYDRKRHETQKRRRKTWLGKRVWRRLPRRLRNLRHRWPLSTEFEHTELDDATRAELAARLRDDANRFRELTGKRFESWSV
jgi:Sulfotransferase family